MRWSQLAGKDIINLHDGERLGRVADAELVLDPATGRITSLVLTRRGRLAGWLGLGGAVTVPWEAIKRIGPEVVLIEIEQRP